MKIIKEINVKKPTLNEITSSNFMLTASIKLNHNISKRLTTKQLAFTLLAIYLNESGITKGKIKLTELLKVIKVISEAKSNRKSLRENDFQEILKSITIGEYIINGKSGKDTNVYGIPFNYIFFNNGIMSFEINTSLLNILTKDTTDKFINFNFNEVNVILENSIKMRNDFTSLYLYCKSRFYHRTEASGYKSYSAIISREKAEELGLNWNKLKTTTVQKWADHINQYANGVHGKIKITSINTVPNGRSKDIVIYGYLVASQTLTINELKTSGRNLSILKELESRQGKIFNVYSNYKEEKGLTNRVVLDINSNNVYCPYPFLTFNSDKYAILDIENYSSSLMNYIKDNNMLFEYSTSGKGIHLFIKNNANFKAGSTNQMFKINGEWAFGDIRGCFKDQYGNDKDKITVIKATLDSLNVDSKIIAIEGLEYRKASKEEVLYYRNKTNNNFVKMGDINLINDFTVNDLLNNKIPSGYRNEAWNAFKINRAQGEITFENFVKEIDCYKSFIPENIYTSLLNETDYKNITKINEKDVVSFDKLENNNFYDDFFWTEEGDEEKDLVALTPQEIKDIEDKRRLLENF